MSPIPCVVKTSLFGISVVISVFLTKLTIISLYLTVTVMPALSIYLSSIYLPIYLSTYYLSICLSIYHLSAYLSTCLSIIYLPIYLSFIYVSIYLPSICLSIDLPIYLSIICLTHPDLISKDGKQGDVCEEFLRSEVAFIQISK